jgi:glutaminase-like protein
VGFRIEASGENPAILYQVLDGVRVEGERLTEPVRVYRPRDTGSAFVYVNVLTGTRAGATGGVRRERLSDDRNGNVTSEPELSRLTTVMGGEFFRDTKDKLQRIPFKYPPDGCGARARVMADLLTAAGYTVSKVFLTYGGLRASTIYGDDPVDLGYSAAVKWDYHVAPLVFLKNTAQPRVIDPSLQDTPLTVDAWAVKMTNKPSQRITYTEMVTRLRTSGQYPRDPNGTPWMVFPSMYTNPLPDAPPYANTPDKIERYTDKQLAEVLEAAAARVPQRVAMGSLSLLMKNWLDAVGRREERRNLRNPYDGWEADLWNVEEKLGLLSNWDRSEVRFNFVTLLLDVKGTFIGSGVENDVTRLLNILTAKATQ